MGDGADLDNLKIEIVDNSGNVVRTLSGSALAREPGVNRVWWDLSLEASNTPKLRTQPLEHDHVPLTDDGWRALSEGGRVRPRAVPGSYTVRLSAGDHVLTNDLEILKDPNSDGDVSQIALQQSHVAQIRDEVNQVVELIDEIEWIRAGIDGLEQRLAANTTREPAQVAEAREAAGALDHKLIALENMLFDLRLTNAGQDTLRWPRRLYAKLISLSAYMSGTDFAPTDQHVEVHEQYQRQLAEYVERMQALRSADLAELNRLLAEHGVGVIGGL